MNKGKVLVTGSEGFIGGAFLKSVADNPDIIISDYNLPPSTSSYDYVHPSSIPDSLWADISLVIHMGALSLTNSTNAHSVFDQNIKSTLNIFDRARNAKIIYASSAAIYGASNSEGVEQPSYENPQSLYAYSKQIVDQIVRLFFKNRPIVGLRFFNVCSFMDEAHKTQPSPTFSFYKQLHETKQIALFHNSDKIFRDFIYIKDVIKIIHFFTTKSLSKSYIINVGTGDPISFESIADNMIDSLGYGYKVYIDRPSNLLDAYQTYTKANIALLRTLGYKNKIPNILNYIRYKFK